MCPGISAATVNLPMASSLFAAHASLCLQVNCCKLQLLLQQTARGSLKLFAFVCRAALATEEAASC